MRSLWEFNCCWHLLRALVIATCCASCIAPGQAQETNTSPSFERTLELRIANNPNSAANWRMLGKWRYKQNDIPGACAACQKAVELDPQNASAHFDLAKVLVSANQPDQAAEHFQIAYAIAPDSDYGVDAAANLQKMGHKVGTVIDDLAESDAQANRFAGIAEDLSAAESGQRFTARLELGAIYNSNVQLAPLNRIVVEPGLGGPQGFLAPDLIWRTAEANDSLFGVRMRGYFNVNESSLSQFDLQEYQPGVFFQRSIFADDTEFVVRVQYDFTFDQFAGAPLATRHSLVSSVEVIGAEADTLVYWGIDATNFHDDGAIAEFDSLDGFTNSLGASRTWYRDVNWLNLVRLGGDLQWAPLEGSDFAYRGIFGYVEGEALTFLEMTLAGQLGIGFREYPDFSSIPSRDETLYRARIELRKSLNEHWELIGSASYDRFACDNDQFDTYRFLTGIVTVFRY